MGYRGAKILVIGGTGTIGAALVKRLLSFGPETLRIYSRDEYKQFLMRDALECYGHIRFLLGDVRDRERLERAMRGIDIVFDLAALKHVPACEYNPFEAVKTNVIGSQNVIDCAIENRVKRVVYTSSDKAVSPTNTMGATKLLAERLFSSADYSKGGGIPVFAAVRLGNVMDSRGSVIPLWRKQISGGRYITITEPLMTRFLMSVGQAAGLLMTACRIARGGEVFVPKMPVVRLCDLAEAVIGMECRKLNLRPDSVEIRKTGLRPGEKMYEELMSEQESHCAIEFRKMFAILPCHKLNFMDNCRLKCTIGGIYSSAGRQTLTVSEIANILEGAAFSAVGFVCDESGDSNISAEAKADCGSCRKLSLNTGGHTDTQDENASDECVSDECVPDECASEQCPPARFGSGNHETVARGRYPRVGVIIQARSNSSRLPGKVLKPLPLNSGTTVLHQVIRRVCAAAGIDDVIVATTVNGCDDAIARIAMEENVKCYRGSESDVLGRYYGAASENGLDIIVRITCDCPCLDPKIIERIVSVLRFSDYDYVSNTIERTYPKGLDVEAFGMKALEKAHAEALEPYDREHVTPYFYHNPALFKCCGIAAADGENAPGIRVTLDTYEDYMLICGVYDYFKDSAFSARDIVALFKAKPWLYVINSSH